MGQLRDAPIEAIPINFHFGFGRIGQMSDFPSPGHRPATAATTGSRGSRSRLGFRIDIAVIGRFRLRLKRDAVELIRGSIQ